jgi:hypothetical protein
MEITKNARLCENASQHAKFGLPSNFSGNIGERALKKIVKDHTEKTQKQPDKFVEQCAIREYESNLIKYIMTDISSQNGMSRH